VLCILLTPRIWNNSCESSAWNFGPKSLRISDIKPHFRIICSKITRATVEASLFLMGAVIMYLENGQMAVNMYLCLGTGYTARIGLLPSVQQVHLKAWGAVDLAWGLTNMACCTLSTALNKHIAVLTKSRPPGP